MTGGIRMIRVDTVKGGYKVGVIRHGWVIIIKEYGSVAHINFFPFGMEDYVLSFACIYCHFVTAKPLCPLLQFRVNTVNEFWKVFTSFKFLGVISKQEGL